MKIEFASFTNVGPRQRNEDRLLSPSSIDAPWMVAAIADGIGGAPGGAEAAEIAVSVAAQTASVAAIPEIFDRIVHRLQDEASSNFGFAKMGTTLSLALLADHIVNVGHVGDSRIYHLRGTGLNSLTNDQTEIAALIRKGILPARQAKRYPRRNVLLSALSPEGKFEVQQAQAALEKGDRLLLLTDGVHQRLTRGAILKTSVEFSSIKDFANRLEQMTLSAEPSDNFSAIAIQIVD